jgi:hypothetical protein
MQPARLRARFLKISSNGERIDRGELVIRIKKVVITAYGDESKLAIVECDLPEPAAGEVQLAVEYTIVSGSDVLSIPEEAAPDSRI